MTGGGQDLLRFNPLTLLLRVRPNLVHAAAPSCLPLFFSHLCIPLQHFMSFLSIFLALRLKSLSPKNITAKKGRESNIDHSFGVDRVLQRSSSMGGWTGSKVHGACRLFGLLLSIIWIHLFDYRGSLGNDVGENEKAAGLSSPSTWVSTAGPPTPAPPLPGLPGHFQRVRMRWDAVGGDGGEHRRCNPKLT